MWNATKLIALRKCRITLRKHKNQKRSSVEFTVVEEDLTPLLGKRASKEMNLITVHYDNIANVQSDSVCERLMTEYSDDFNKLG